MEFTTLTSWPLLTWKALLAEGTDPRALFAQVGLDAEQLDHAGARFPQARVQALFRAAPQHSSARCFGLAAASHWHPTTLHAVGIAWFSSATLLDAFQRFARNLAVVSTGMTGRIERQRDDYLFTMAPRRPTERLAEESVHAGLGVLMHMARASCGQDFKPREVRLTVSRTACHDALEAFVGCPITYDARALELLMPAADLQRGLLTGNRDLLHSADNIIADYLRQQAPDSFVALAREQVLRQLPTGNVSEESVAAALHVSPRTLQRRLQAQGSGYRLVLESVRKEMAQRYIADDRYSITEISYLLGFAEPSSFARSFKRWTGSTPSASRPDR